MNEEIYKMNDTSCMIIIKIWDYCYVNELETVQEVNIAIAIETPKQYYDMMNIWESKGQGLTRV